MSENDRYTRITVPLSQVEFEALKASAQRDYRHPRDQARYLLHLVLLNEPLVPSPANEVGPRVSA